MDLKVPSPGSNAGITTSKPYYLPHTCIMVIQSQALYTPSLTINSPFSKPKPRTLTKACLTDWCLVGNKGIESLYNPPLLYSLIPYQVPVSEVPQRTLNPKGLGLRV